MPNTRKWAIIRAIKMTPEEKEAKKLAKKVAKQAEREAKKLEKQLAKEAEKEMKKLERQLAKEQKKKSKALATVETMPAPADKADLVRKLAEEVYAELGPGHTESVYHNAMKIQLQDAGLQYESERDIPVLFKTRYVGTVRADVIVNHEIVLEFKIAGKIDDAMLQCRQYMKLQTIPYGFVVLFPKREGESVIIKDCTRPEEE
jgi:GxxExxY protein